VTIKKEKPETLKTAPRPLVFIDSFIFMPAFRFRNVAGTAARGGLEIPHVNSSLR